MTRKRIPLTAIDDYNSGLSVQQVAKKYGVSGTGVWDLLKRHGVECRGSRNFTDAEELQIAHIYRAEHSVKAIMRAYGFRHHISFVSALNRQGVKQRKPADRNRLYELNRHVFDVIDNELAAYFWGFLYADGTVYKRTLLVALSMKDKAQVEKLKQFLECEHPVKEVDEKLNGNVYKKSVLHVTSKYLTDRLRQLGVKKGRDDFQKRVVDQLPEYLINHWVRGYFDGDGSFVRTKPNTSILGQKELLEWIRRQLSIGAGTKPDAAITKRKGADIYSLSFGGRIQLLNIAEYLYKDATIWMDRKRQVAEEWKKKEAGYY